VAEAPEPQSTPRRPHKEHEDNHYHDDDEVAQLPPDEDVPHGAPRAAPRTPRKLAPPPRRFYED
jgi:hypothetical protein